MLITPERLTISETPIATGSTSKIFSAKLDKGSKTSRDVAVKEFVRRGAECRRRGLSNSSGGAMVSSVPKSNPFVCSGWNFSLQIANALNAWRQLEHPNVRELIGCSLHPTFDSEIYRLISPYFIHGNIREHLAQAPVGVPQRLGFVSIPFPCLRGTVLMLSPKVRDHVTAGLDYLHSRSPPICHGNLNPLMSLHISPRIDHKI